MISGIERLNNGPRGLSAFKLKMHGPVGPAVDSRDIDRLHLSALVPLVAVVIALGLYPNFVVHRTEKATTGAIAEARVAGTAQAAGATQEVSAIP